MANQQVIDRASQRARAGLEVAPEFFAQIAGALFGILSGIKLLLGAFIADVKSLSSTTGRRQIFYGRQGPKPVTFEGTDEVAGIQTQAKATFAQAKQTVSDAVSNPSETISQAKATVYGKASQTKGKAGQVLEGSNINPETLPSLKSTQAKLPGSAALGPGSVIPTKSAKPSTGERLVPGELDSELRKAPIQHVNVSQKTSYVSKTNGEYQPSTAPVTLPDGAHHEDSPGEDEDDDEERSGPLSRNSSISDHSSATDLPKRPKRGKRVMNKLKGVFKAS